jgi:hypothetical protein
MPAPDRLEPVRHHGNSTVAITSQSPRNHPRHHRKERSMKSIVLLVVGTAAGFAIAHQVNKSPAGRKFFGQVETRAREFGSALIDGYKTREADLHSE